MEQAVGRKDLSERKRLFDAALGKLSQGKAIPANTEKAMRRGWTLYLDWAESHVGNRLLTATQKDGEAYLHHLLDTSSPATVRNRLSQARHLYSLWRALKETKADPFFKVRAPASNRRAPPLSFSREEIGQLAHHADPRQQALVCLGLYDLLPADCTASLTWADVDLPSQMVLVKLGGDVELLPLDKRTVQALAALGQGLGPLFPDWSTPSRVEGAMKRLCAAADVPPLGWQALRTRGALMALQTGASARRALYDRFKQRLGLRSDRAVQLLAQAARAEQRTGATTARTRRAPPPEQLATLLGLLRRMRGNRDWPITEIVRDLGRLGIHVDAQEVNEAIRPKTRG